MQGMENKAKYSLLEIKTVTDTNNRIYQYQNFEELVKTFFHGIKRLHHFSISSHRNQSSIMS